MATTQDANLQAVRRQLTTLARRRRARHNRFTPERPVGWRPDSVIDPQTGASFSPEAAWEYVASGRARPT